VDLRSILIPSLVHCSFDHDTLMLERTPPHQFLVICLPTFVLDESNPNTRPGCLALVYVLEKASVFSFSSKPELHIFIMVEAQVNLHHSLGSSLFVLTEMSSLFVLCL